MYSPLKKYVSGDGMPHDKLSLPREMVREKPYERIIKKCCIPEHLKKFLPHKWEMIGDILIISLDKNLLIYKKEIGRAYAGILGVKSVVRIVGRIHGRERIPNMEMIYGNESETIHKENGILYRLDVLKVMFSSGNVDERIRMANIDCREKIVVDMFAGIGYFTLPLSIKAGAKKVYACEINPTAFRYLLENIELNRACGKVVPVLGDSLTVAPEDVADRVVMGYLWSMNYLEKAIRCLRDKCGIVHYHEACHEEDLPDLPLSRIEKAATRYNRVLTHYKIRIVKSYAPRVYHIVIDAKIGKNKK